MDFQLRRRYVRLETEKNDENNVTATLHCSFDIPYLVVIDECVAATFTAVDNIYIFFYRPVD